MSFVRTSRINRNALPETKTEKVPCTGRKSTASRSPAKNEKCPSPKPPTKKASPKSSQKARSLSQPSNSSINIKTSSRPHSGGDERQTLVVSKFNKSIKSTVSEESELEEFDYPATTLYRKKEGDRCADHDIDEERISCSNIKSSTSGIPMRIKQRPPTPKTSPRQKTTPRSIKSSIHSVSQASSRGILKTPSSLDAKNTPHSRRNLEIQFQTKKKKLELLKKEIDERQKPLMDYYHSLIQLKRKLESDGKTKLVLDEIRVVCFGDYTEMSSNRARPSEDTMSSLTSPSAETAGKMAVIYPDVVCGMKDLIRQIPVSLLEVCKNLMTRRLSLFEFIKKLTNGPVAQEEIEFNLQAIKKETADLESVLESTFVQQESRVSELIEKWNILLHGNGDCANFAEHVEQLQDKLKLKEKQMGEATSELDQIKSKADQETQQSQATINDLKERIKTLEQYQDQDRTLIQEQKKKNGLLEHKFKLLQNRSKEVEGKHKDAETKLSDLQKQHKHSLEQLSANERRWLVEKEEIIAKHKHDKQILDKLTKDRSHIDTRMKTLAEMNDEWQMKYSELEKRTTQEVEEARKCMMQEKTERETMEKMYEGIKDQLVEMEIKNRQAVDIVKTKGNSFDGNETENGITTEKEAELYTELLATRIALRSAEDQIVNYNREKMRFIDSIQALQGNKEKDQENLAQSLVNNVQKLTELETKLQADEEIIYKQRLEIDSLKLECENMKQRNEINCGGECESEHSADMRDDLRVMLYEGKKKLEQSLKKSVEYECKIIRYEHEINRQSKQLCEMENLLKVRDGLISMIKAKKDELQSENSSLTKYANEIRQLLIEATVEAESRSALVQELSSNLDSRSRVCEQLEKKIKELETSLSATNEKRFKLQDTLGAMEKELQCTRIHITQLAPEIKARYGIDLKVSSTNNTFCAIKSRESMKHCPQSLTVQHEIPQLLNNCNIKKKVSELEAKRKNSISQQCSINYLQASTLATVASCVDRKTVSKFSTSVNASKTDDCLPLARSNNSKFNFKEDLKELQKVIDELNYQTLNGTPSELNTLIADQTPLSLPSQIFSSSTWCTSDSANATGNEACQNIGSKQLFLPITDSVDFIKVCKSTEHLFKSSNQESNVDRENWEEGQIDYEKKRFQVKSDDCIFNISEFEPSFEYTNDFEATNQNLDQNKMLELVRKIKRTNKTKKKIFKNVLYHRVPRLTKNYIDNSSEDWEHGSSKYSQNFQDVDFENLKVTSPLNICNEQVDKLQEKFHSFMNAERDIDEDYIPEKPTVDVLQNESENSGNEDGSAYEHRSVRSESKFEEDLILGTREILSKSYCDNHGDFRHILVTPDNYKRCFRKTTDSCNFDEGNMLKRKSNSSSSTTSTLKESEKTTSNPYQFRSMARTPRLVETCRHNRVQLDVERVIFIKHIHNISRHLNKRTFVYPKFELDSTSNACTSRLDSCCSFSMKYFPECCVNHEICGNPAEMEASEVFDGRTLTAYLMSRNNNSIGSNFAVSNHLSNA